MQQDPNTIYVSHIWCFLHSPGHWSLFYFWVEFHFLPSTLHLHPHNVCLVNIFDLFIPVIILKTYIFKSSVLFGTYNLWDWDKSLRVLQLLTHLSDLMTNE